MVSDEERRLSKSLPVKLSHSESRGDASASSRSEQTSLGHDGADSCPNTVTSSPTHFERHDDATATPIIEMVAVSFPLVQVREGDHAASSGVGGSSNSPNGLNGIGGINGRNGHSSGGGDEVSSNLAHEEGAFPEGGQEAWLVVLGAWLALFGSLGIMNSLATFQTYVSQHQLVDDSQGKIGWIFSLYAFICFFAGVYVGPIFDKYGPRWLVTTGTVCLVASLVLLSFCKLFWQFVLVFGMLGGFASALLFTPSIAAVGHFFKERRAFATGIATTGGGIGGVCIPLMLQSLFDKIGWAWAVRALALLFFVLSAIACLLLRSRLPPEINASAHPDPRIFLSLPFALTTVGIFLLEFSLFIPLTYISLYALSRGFSASFASQVVTVLNAGSVVGRVLPGWYADKIGPFNANMLAIMMTIVSCLGVWLPTSILSQTKTDTSHGGDRNSTAAAPIVLFALLFGFTSGCNIGLTPVSIGRLCATVNYGRYYATCYTVVSVATLIGIPIAGNILSHNSGKFWGLIVFTSSLYAGALIAFMAAKVSVVGWKLMAIF